jgi:hypothetical protein
MELTDGLLAVMRLERADGDPVPDAWLEATFIMSAKNPYRMMIGPTDSTGTVQLTLSDVEAWTGQQRRLAMMDYVPFDKSWPGVLEIRIAGRERVDAALRSASMFAKSFQYPSMYDQDLRRWLASDSMDATDSFKVVVVTARDEVRVVTR